MHAALSEIQFEVYHVSMSEKLKHLKEEESWPFGPSCASNSLYLRVISTPPFSMSATLFSVLTFHVRLMAQIKLFSPNKFCEMDT